MPVSTQQIAIRVDEALLEAVDRLVAQGAFQSRADVVRRGLELVVDVAEQRRIDEATIVGYQRIPQEPGDDEWALASLRESIAEEPW